MAEAMMVKRMTRQSRLFRKYDANSNVGACHKKRDGSQKQVRLTANDLLKVGMAGGSVVMVPSILVLLRYRVKSSHSWTKVEEDLLRRQRSLKGTVDSQILNIPSYPNDSQARRR